jgi:hypothetical protein
MRALAKVKNFHPDRGFGFAEITTGDDEGEEVFVLVSALGYHAEEGDYPERGDILDVKYVPSEREGAPFHAKWAELHETSL